MKRLAKVIFIIFILAAMTASVCSAVDGAETEEAAGGADTVNAMPPTIEFSGVAGDYSAYLTWSANGNGASVEKFEISYALAASPDAMIDTVTLPADTSAATLGGLTGGMEHIIRLTAYNSAGSTTSTITVTPNDPDLANVTAVKNEIEASSLTIHMNIANTRTEAENYLKNYFSRYDDYGVLMNDVVITEFTPAEQKTAESPDAQPGEFSFIAELQKGDVSMTTGRVRATIDNSTSIVYLSVSKYSVLTNEPLTVTAHVLDISDSEFIWYRAENNTDEGVMIKGVTSAEYNVDTKTPGEFYVYCICGGISSSRIKLSVTEPFVSVSDIELSTDIINVSETSVLHSTVFPFGATNNTIIWTIENDGGCLPELNGRIITAYKPGTITMKATILNGLSDGDYEKTFYITVKEKTDMTQTEPVTETESPGIQTVELDCSKIDGIDSISISAENGEIQITSVTDETILQILRDNEIDAKLKDVIAAVKFVYEKDAIAHDTAIKLKGHNGENIRILSINVSGGKNLTEQKPENGVLYGNSVSPDTVILLKEKAENGKISTFLTAALLIIPAASAAVFIAVVVIQGNKYKRKRSKK